MPNLLFIHGKNKYLHRDILNFVYRQTIITATGDVQNILTRYDTSIWATGQSATLNVVKGNVLLHGRLLTSALRKYHKNIPRIRT